MLEIFIILYFLHDLLFNIFFYIINFMLHWLLATFFYLFVSFSTDEITDITEQHSIN